MVPQSNGKIFLSGERGLNELDWFRSHNTFNFRRYYNDHKTPFGALYVLNEDTLAEDCRIAMEVEDDSHIILVPVVGAVAWKTSRNEEGLVEAGQSQVLPLLKGASIEIMNPYADTSVKYLQLWIKTPGGAQQTAHRLFSFSIDDNKNKLVKAFANGGSPFPGASNEGGSPLANVFIGSIGKFTGREEATYHLTDPRNGIFAFVLQGAFEVQYRLLHAGDGLALWQLPEIELEALSNDAIILLIEINL